MKYNELNKDVKPEYVNTFRLYPSESEIIIDFAAIDHASTKLKAESDGRERPEEIVINTKARLVMPHALVTQLHKVLDQMINPPKEEEAEPNDGKENIGADSGNRSADL